VRLAVTVAASALLATVVVACSSSGKPSDGGMATGSASTSMSSATGPAAGSSGAGAPTAQTEAMIHISSFKYSVPASVSPGATVSVMNMDNESHTVTADSAGAFDDQASAGAVTMFKAPMKAGSYPFHCAYHSNMHGTLLVK
jgi:plastocyanin